MRNNIKELHIGFDAGSECLTVVEQCGCEASCYRALHFQQVYNYTEADEPTVEVSQSGGIGVGEESRQISRKMEVTR